MRIAPLAVTGGLVIAATASGITYAASGGSAAVHACMDARGALALLNSHGHCPPHYGKVTINDRGPRGKIGPRGKPGSPGQAGPGATGLSVVSTSGLATKESQTIAGSGLSVEVLCDPADSAQVYLNLNATGSPYTFEGTASSDGTGSLLYENPTSTGTVNVPLGGTSKEVAAAQPGDPHSVEFTVQSGSLSGTVLVTQGNSIFTVQLGAHQDATSCWSHALITPAS